MFITGETKKPDGYACKKATCDDCGHVIYLCLDGALTDKNAHKIPHLCEGCANDLYSGECGDDMIYL